MKLIDIIEVFIAGDWGEETYSKETPCAVTCVRGLILFQYQNMISRQFQSAILTNKHMQKNVFK